MRKDATAHRPAHQQQEATVTWKLVLAAGAAMVWWLLWLRGRPDVDVWLHLRIGAALRHGERFQALPDPLVAVADIPYVPSQWLAQVIGSSVHQATGMVGLHALRYVCIATVTVAVYIAARSFGQPTASAVITVMTLFCTSAAWGERPQLAGLALCAVLVAVWSRVLAGAGPPVILIPLTWVWAMLHGTWALGIAISVIFVVANALQSTSSPRRLTALLAVVGGQVAVVAMTPLGPSLLLQPFKVGSSARDGVNEWQTPSLTNPLLVVAALLGLVTVAYSIRSLSRHLPELLLAGAGVALAAWSVRTIAFGALLLAPAVAMSLRERQRGSTALSTQELWPAVLALAGLSLLPGVVWGAPSGGPLSRAADASLSALPAGSRVAVEPFSSGWVLWAHPQIRVVRDLRAEMYSQSTAAQYEAFTRAEPGWQQYADREDINGVVTATRSPLDLALGAERGWAVVTRDDERVVWRRLS